MTIESILLIAAAIILWLVIKAALKMVMISFSTALQIFIILVVLRVFFTIMPQDVLRQIREFPQLVWNLF
jgi:hypothetical protein